MQRFDGKRRSLEEKSRGNRRSNWDKRRNMRDDKRGKNESGQKGRNDPNHVRLTNAVNQQVKDAQKLIVFSHVALSIRLKLRFEDLE